MITRRQNERREDADAAVLLETDELVVRGEARTRVPRQSITRIQNKGGRVTVYHATGSVTLDLGSAAEKWASKLTEPPKSRLDKLGIAPDTRVSVVRIRDTEFLAELAARTPHVSRSRARPTDDVVMLGVERVQDLSAIARIARTLGPTAALWVVHPKGAGGVADTAIYAVARDAGLTYTKVARFSATHTAEKLVIPRERRPRAPSPGTAGRGRSTGSAR